MPTGLRAGLCDRCRHQRLVPTTRGPVYSRCERARSEPARYPRYPRLPVVGCAGFEPTADANAAPPPGRPRPGPAMDR